MMCGTQSPAVKPNRPTHAAGSMLRLKRELGAITAVIPEGSHIALLDEPVNRSIGDHLIHLGTERFFLEHNIITVARANLYNYHRRWLGRIIGNDTIIACYGGGNFGDIHLQHQQLRERLVTDFPDHRIVVLPQSVYFRDTGRMQQAAAVFRNHADLHLFLRDRRSRQQAEAMRLDNLYLVPDMAHALYPLNGADDPADPRGETLYLLRRDKERTAAIRVPERVKAVCDWPDLIHPRDSLTLAAAATACRLFRRFNPPGFLNSLLDRQRTALVERAIGLFAGYNQIVTSRLHGALLGLLLGKRVRLLNSLTGKSHSYYETWLTDHEDCEYASPL